MAVAVKIKLKSRDCLNQEDQIDWDSIPQEDMITLFETCLWELRKELA